MRNYEAEIKMLQQLLRSKEQGIRDIKDQIKFLEGKIEEEKEKAVNTEKNNEVLTALIGKLVEDRGGSATINIERLAEDRIGKKVSVQRSGNLSGETLVIIKVI